MNRLLTISEADYFSDNLPGVGDCPTLSQSTAHALISKSAYHARKWHPKLGGEVRYATAEMELGTFIHAELLGQPTDYAVIKYDDFRTKAAQALRDSAIAAGLKPILEREHDRMKAIASAVRRQISAFGYSLTGQTEGVVLWSEVIDGQQIFLKGRVDHWDCVGTVIDLKTTKDARPSKCVKSILEFGYDIQAAANIEGIENTFPDLAGRVKFVNLFIETEAPYLIVPAVQDGSLLAIGRSKWRRAKRAWAKCLKENSWPGYVTTTTSVAAPSYAIAEELFINPHDEALNVYA